MQINENRTLSYYDRKADLNRDWFSSEMLKSHFWKLAWVGNINFRKSRERQKNAKNLPLSNSVVYLETLSKTSKCVPRQIFILKFINFKKI